MATSPITVMLDRLEKVTIAALHEASGSGIDESQLDGRTGDEVLVVHLYLKNDLR